MKFIAIASINKGESLLGARILNTENTKIQDYNLEQIENILSQNTNIRNITLENGKITWSQGSASRYPVLDASNPSVVSNINSIIVIGKYNEGMNLTKFIVANYEGKLATLSEDKLLEYGKQYTLANCKVYTKDNKSHIASLSGEIDTLPTEAEFSYNEDNREITVKLPPMGCTKLAIPQSINGITMTSPLKINVRPLGVASMTNHLVLSKSMNHINPYTFSDMPNLKVIECNASIEQIKAKSFSYCKGITEIYIGGISGKASTMFGGLKSLRNVKFGVKPEIIQSSTYEDCISINIDSILYEGLLGIREKAFDGCTQLENVTLPNSLKRLNVSAFRNCTGLKSLKISNSDLVIDGDWEKSKRNSREKETNISIKLLADSPNAILYCPYSFPESILKECVAEHVRIIKGEPTENDKNLYNKQAKASMLGLKIKIAGAASTAKEVVGFLTVISDGELKEAILNCIKEKLKTHSENEDMFNIECKGAHLQISLGHSMFWRTAGKYVTQSKVGKNYMYVLKRGQIVVYLIDRQLIKQYVEKHIANGNERKIRSNSSWRKNENGIFLLDIPAEVSYLPSVAVSKTYETENGIMIEYKDGSKEEIKVVQ